MDITRAAYSMPCRFFSNSDVISEVRWQEAEENAEAIPFESVILCTKQEPDDGEPYPVGEVAGAKRTYTLANAPRGLAGDHVCGTQEDFANGCVRDAALPPVQYGATGYPLCCFPPKLVRGGAAVSGRSSFVPSRKVTRGGAAVSGRAVYTVDPVSPTPGSDCATAPTLALDVEYAYPTITGGPSGDWFRWNALMNGAPYHLRYTGPAGSLPFFFGFSSCAGGTTVITPTFHGPDCYEITFTAGPNLLLEIRTFGPSDGPYTFTLSAGTC